MELLDEMREEIYEITEPRNYGYKRRIFQCELCKKLIDSPKYICSVIPHYDLKNYYHTMCYVKYLQLEEYIDERY